MRTKQNIEGIYPLSPLQQGILFHSLEAASGQDPYRTLECFALRGKLDADTLEASWRDVIGRHEALRSDLRWSETREPVQIVYKVSDFALRRASLAGTGTSPDLSAEERLQGFTRAEQATPLNLQRSADLRLTLLDADTDEHYLVWEYHHLLLDGWSVANVLGEVLTSYQARRLGEQPQLSRVPPLRDYVRWLKRRDRTVAEAHFERLLTGYTPGRAFPPETRWPQPPVAGVPTEPTLFAEQQLTLDAETSRFIADTLRDWRVTPSSFFQGLWALAIGAHAGTRDVVFGTTVAGRPAELNGSEGMVGVFINTLPQRILLDPKICVKDWLRRLQDDGNAAREFEYAPLANLKRKSEIAHAAPLFESIVVFENYPVAEALNRFSDLGLDVAVARPGTTRCGEILFNGGRNNYPLCLVVSPGERFELIVAYHCDRVAHTFANSLLRLLRELAAAVPRDSGTRLVELPCAAAAERAQQREWAGRAERGQRPSVPEWFLEVARARGDALAVRGEDDELSYAELSRQAQRVANWLRAHGVRAGDRVGLCARRGVGFVVGIFGILLAGAAYVPFESKQPPLRLRALLADCRAKLLLCDPELPDELVPDALGLPLHSLQQVQRDATGDFVPPCLSPHSTAYVIYTSGSTGNPKGVEISHAGLQSYVEALLQRLALHQLPAAPSMAMVSTVSADLGNTVLFGALCAGGTLHLLSDSRVFDPDAVADYFTRYHIDVIRIVPCHLKGLLQAQQPERVLPRHALILGGEASPWQLIDKLQSLASCRIINHYGPTETTVGVLTYELGTDAPRPSSSSLPTGRPLPNSRVLLLDPDFKLVPPGVEAELFIGGYGLAHGYLGQPDHTADRFVPDPFPDSPQGGARLYRTGDRARYLPDGAIEFLGRADQQVKLRGYRVELAEISCALRSLDGITDAEVLLCTGHSGNSQLVAYLIGTPLGSDLVQNYLRQRLPEHMVPSDFVWLERFPVTSNGKLDKTALPKPGTLPPGLQKTTVLPRNDIERKLASVWCDVLKLPSVGIHDNFFKLGGDSILVLQVLARARKLNLQLTPKQLFEHQTIAEAATVATALDPRTKPVSGSSLVSGDVPLTPIQRWFFAHHAETQSSVHHFNQSVLLQVSRKLDVTLLQRALDELVRHHDALRLRFCSDGGRWRQYYGDHAESLTWTRLDLGACDDIATAVERTAEEAQRGLNIERGPIARAVYIDLGSERPARLLFVVHHLVIDGVSWRILLEDLGTLCGQLSTAKSPDLGPKFSSWLAWSQSLAASAPAAQGELDYWRAVLRDAPTIPVSNAAAKNSVAAARSMVAQLSDSDTSRLLTDVHRAYRTQISDILLTALARAVCAWTGLREVLVELEGHGRSELKEADVSRTVGWFTTLYPVRLSADPDDLGRSLKAVKETLRAVPQKGLGYGLLRHMSEHAAEFESLAVPSFTFNYLGQLDQVLAGDELFAPADESEGTARDPEGLRRTWLDFELWVRDGRLSIELVYCEQLHDASEASQLLERYVVELRRLIDHCCRPDVAGITPSDFPLAKLDQAGLDGLGVAAGDIEDLYPLSPVQEGMLFHCLLEPGAGVYLTQRSSELHSALDLAALRRAWRSTIAAHPILRTAFIHEGLARPLQLVHRSAALDITELDWSSEPEPKLALERYLARDRERDFDLSRPPLLRLCVMRLEHDRYYLVWTQHHLLLDGWSSARLLTEVFERYSKISTGHTIAQSPAPSYRAYIAWLAQQDQSHADRFWKHALAGLQTPSLLASSVAHRHPGRGHASAQKTLTVELDAALRSLAQARGLTLNTLFQGAVAYLLSVYCRSDDVVLGVTVSGRSAPLAGIERTLGLFINSLPLRVRVDRSATIASWLSALQSGNAALCEHEWSPLISLRRHAELPSGAPLFDTLLVFENYPIEPALQARAETLRIGEVSSIEHNNYPLTFLVEPAELCMLRADYDRSHFDADLALRLLEHTERILAAFVSAPDAALGTISLVDGRERALFGQWNETGSSRSVTRLTHELFAARAALAPSAVAVELGERQLEYRELAARTRRLARALIERGVGPDDLVGIHLPRSLSMVVAVLAVFEAGAGYLPLDPEYPTERIDFMLDDARPKLVLAEARSWEKLAKADSEVLRVDTDGELHRKHHTPRAVSCGARARSPLPDNIAYCIYTSGSTGRPKGVMVTQRNLANFLASMQRVLGMTAADKVLGLASLSFDISGLELLLPLIVGARVVLTDRATAIDAEAIVDCVRRRGVTVLQATPTTWRALADTPGFDAMPVRSFVTGGEALAPDLARCLARSAQREPPFGSRAVWNSYGPTETTIYSSARALDLDHPEPLLGGLLANTQFYLLDDALRLVPLGVVGEIYIAGEGLARGYLHRPDMTAERFVPNPYSAQPGDRLYRSGDLARCRPDGSLEFVGRRDHQVKIRGHRIELGEIEARLVEHESLTAATVIAVRTTSESKLVAYVVAALQPETLDAQAKLREELRAALKAQLPEYMRPSNYVFLEQLPLTANGKLDTRALPRPAEAEQRNDMPPRNDVERQLVRIWQDALGLERVSVFDDFFELGGHSLSAVRAMQALGTALKLDLPIALIFQFSVLAELGEAVLAERRRTGLKTLVALKPRTEGNPVYCVHPAGGHLISYRRLAERLGDLAPVYGLQARSFYREDWIDESIASMAEHYADELESLRPARVNLLGWSFGGVMALELARVCERRGLTLGFVGLIDAVGLLDTKRESDARRIANCDEARVRVLARWFDRAQLAPKWRRLLETVDADTRAWLTSWFFESGLSEQDLDLIAENELFNAANTFALMRSYRAKRITSPVHAWWARASVAELGTVHVERQLDTLGVAHSRIIEADHETIINSEDLLSSVRELFSAVLSNERRDIS